MRFLVLSLIALCLLSAAKVGLLRWKAQDGENAPLTSVWEADGRLRAYPTAKLSRWDHWVYSPYREETLLDVSGYNPGDLMLCGASKRPFYVPLRHDLDYGEIVGDWVIQRSDRQGTTEYHLRLLGELQGISGYGRRLRSQGRLLDSGEQSSIRLEGTFEDDHLVCPYVETGPDGTELERGEFRWVFSSAQDALHGAVQTPEGLINSQGRRTVGSRGSIPASGGTPESFVPAEWTLRDSLTGRLHTAGEGEASFLVAVLDEKGPQAERWLLMAHRAHRHQDYQTVLLTPHACLPPHGSGKGDPFHGLFLPQAGRQGGIFGIRHHDAQDDLHAGVDAWFQYDPGSQDWRLSEGKRYRFDLGDPSDRPDWVSLMPGTSLAAFDITKVQHPPPAPGEAPTSSGDLTASR